MPGPCIASPDLSRHGGPGSDRRRHERYPFSCEVHFGDPVLNAAAGVDLSLSGVGLVAPEGAPLGEELEVAFLERSVAVRGIVRSVTRVEDGYRLGIEFLAEEPEVVEVVRRYSP